MSDTEQIFIPLRDEGVEVWRPTQAQRLADGSYRVLPSVDYDPADETWKFPPGTRVICQRRQLAQGNVLAATALAPAGRQTA